MTRRNKWLVWAGIPLLLLAAIWITALLLIPSDEELAARASAELEKALGVPVDVGAVHWTLFPLVSATIENVETRQKQPITIRKLTAWPDLGALLQRELRVERVELDGAVVPQLSLRGLGASGQKQADQPVRDDIPLARFVFRDLTWISRRGIPVVYEGEVDFEPMWRPHELKLRVPGAATATNLTFTRIGQEDRWTTLINVGGGTGNGEVQLHEDKGGSFRITGQLAPRNLEVASALAAFNRKSAVSGRANGSTTLSAKGQTLGEITQSLHTTTRFKMAPATILRFDLDKAIRTVGKEHAGQTPLESLTGQLDTQNTPDGLVSTYTGLKAQSGSLSATGDVTLANRTVNAELAVDLVDGIVGVPLTIKGPYSDLSFSMPGGAVAGAVVGTAVLPGIGTVIGARIGAAIGKVFKGAPAPANKASSPRAKPVSRP
ncbi:MAG: AsmA-like C-terminal region-containing protein [Polaromonas sp.]|nr:AsmA-like C-terminal region-containing protein [Polaromonas sp.]